MIPREIEAVFEHTGNEFSLSQSQAVTLGLIINELVTNSVKYAFPGRSDCRIAVSIHEHLGCCFAEISDNGCGFDGEVKGTGKGLELMKALTHELEGDLDLRASKDGTTAKITFPIFTESSRGRDEPTGLALH
jgi:two-component sensor histidine kinase